MKNQSHISFIAPLALSTSKDAALPAKFAGIAYSGGKVPGYGVVIDLATTKFSPTMPLLAEHNRKEIIGAIDSTVNSGSNLIVSGKLFSDIPGSTGEKIAQCAQRGAPYQMSVGLFGYEELWLEGGSSLTVNGKTITGPVTVLKNGHVREVSIVALGADPFTDAQFFNASTTPPFARKVSGAELAPNSSPARAKLDAEAKAYMAANPGTDYIGALRKIEAADA